MDLLNAAAAGFEGCNAPASVKQQALKYLRDWYTKAEFEAYRPQLHWLMEQQQWAGLLDRFCQILPFGTGGRRGAVGIGPNRMNRWTLGASVQGHCEYLRQRFPGVERLQVALAYDVRQFEDKQRRYNAALPNPVLHLSSRDMAQHAAEIYAANGIHAWILPADSKQFYATPELSFAIRKLHCHGGLNISASHNPPDDNGGKFYDERGGQPVPPDDQLMADLVDQVGTIRVLPWAEAIRAGRVHFFDDAVHRAYIDLCRKQSLVAPPKKDEDFKVVFTPLHGVGAMTAMETLVEQGFRVVPVAEQMTPDGQFPNVTKTPNPEVPASMDRAAALARQQRADIVLSTDPDADRLGAMIPAVRGPGPWSETPEYRFVTGNEIAALLTHFKLAKLKEQGRMPPSPIVIRTEVTTAQASRIARHFRAQVVDNLMVGFKYIAEVIRQLEQHGAYEDVRGTPADFIIATEESHGALLMPAIRDKDAAAAALLLAELALDQKRRGKTVLDYLEQLYRDFGYFRHDGVPIFLAGIEGRQQMSQMLDALRQQPPRTIGGLAVTRFEDLRDETGRLGPLKGPTDAASRNFLIFHCGEQVKLALRPSGTEPKAKIYVECCSAPCPAGATPEQWRQTCAAVDQLTKTVSADLVRQALQLIGLDPSAAGMK